MKVNISITDSPLFNSFDYIFSGLEEVGANGIELVLGIKSRWNFKRIVGIAERHNLRIRSIHQPAWSVLGYWFDEGFIKAGVNEGISTFVFHPPLRYSNLSIRSEILQQYFKRLALIQKKYGVKVLVENMARVIRPKVLRKIFPFHIDLIDPIRINTTIQKFGLGITYDTSHAYLNNPFNDKSFTKILPSIENIHLSSFGETQDHLPLHLGNFKTKEFIKNLKIRDYRGMITLEIFYPKKLIIKGYDFQAIKKSIQLIKENL